MIKTFIALSFLGEDVGMEGRFTADSDLKNGPLIVKVPRDISPPLRALMFTND